jgi:hypothetical protein
VLVLGALVVGVLTGTALALLHTGWAWLVVGVLAAAATLRWLPANGPRVAFAVGWCLPVARGVLTRPEGDYLVASNAQGWSLVALSLAVLLAALATLRLRPAGVADPGVGSPPT